MSTENFNEIPYKLLKEKVSVLESTVDYQDWMIRHLELEAAKYKAMTFHRYDLAEKLERQIRKNDISKEKYVRLNGMFKEKIINQEEYEFCKLYERKAK